jgi:hypothetical protein
MSLALILLSLGTSAEERPLRFSVSESWAMPMIHIEHGQATGGVLYDLQQRLAEKVGRRAEMLVRPRLRIQQMLVRGEIDVRCYVNPAWLSESHLDILPALALPGASHQRRKGEDSYGAMLLSRLRRFGGFLLLTA